MKRLPNLVDYSQIEISRPKIIYTRKEKLSIFFNGILLLSIITSFLFLYYRYKTKDYDEKEIQKKIQELNNLTYNKI